MTRLLAKFPYFISYFLGYRRPDHKPKTLAVWRIYLWSFLAAWIGIAVLEIVFAYGPSFIEHQSPIVIASFGATAVLVYGVIDSPLAQPRNVIGGHIVGALSGAIISQLFLGIKQTWESESQRLAVQWVGGATAMALSLTVMQITKTVHPPGGATALIAVVTPSIIQIRWFYVGIVALSSVLQVVIACLINNIERKYPLYWWTPDKLPLKVDPATLSTVIPTHGTRRHEDTVFDNLTNVEEGRIQEGQYSNDKDDTSSHEVLEGIVVTETRSSSATALGHAHAVHKALSALEENASTWNDRESQYILLTARNQIFISPHIQLTESEKATLDSLISKLQQS
ncbi:HPP family-domain-containing protein [Choanephora cucurbitarum]|nr:HPP family-domain-containing protein [Choanephora cucurbitarum]